MFVCNITSILLFKVSFYNIWSLCFFIHTRVRLTYIVCGNACFHLFMVIYPQEARLLTYWVFTPQFYFYSQSIRICLQFHEKELLTIFSVFNHGKFQTYKRRKLLCSFKNYQLMVYLIFLYKTTNFLYLQDDFEAKARHQYVSSINILCMSLKDKDSKRI